MRLFMGILIAVFVTGLSFPQPATAKIEAVKGKQYHLTPKHGPWMIMVAVFSAPPEEMRTEGLTPDQAAEALVYELRTKGIPAYSFRREQKTESIETVNRLQQAVKREYKLDAEFCVLAGNFQTPESDKALGKRTLAWIKKYHPESLGDSGIYKSTPGQPSPLSGAFLTINPLLDADDVKKRQQDQELLAYNKHYDHSLLTNPGKYTVTVASFYPNSVTQISGNSSGTKDLRSNGSFQQAGDQAWQVMRALREKNIEAYVYHDHRKSIVTVGSFNSPQDPMIKKVHEMFGAQYKPDPTTGQLQLIGEVIVLPSRDGEWMCTFDPDPKVIEVPFKH